MFAIVVFVFGFIGFRCKVGLVKSWVEGVVSSGSCGVVERCFTEVGRSGVEEN